MQIDIEQKVIKLLHRQNPWWEKDRVPENLTKPFKRRDFYVIRDKRLSEGEITAIVGPRQVGKTTMIYQLIEHLIHEKKVNPKRILYVSFDYPYLTTIMDTPLNNILEVYSSQVLKEPISRLGDRIYVFLDEVCKLENWSSILKGWYDLKYPIKFIISDSSSANILQGSSESLAGRISVQIMLPLKFLDFLRYHMPEKDSIFKRANKTLRDAFIDSLRKSNPNLFYSALRESYLSLAPYEDEIKIHLQTYLLKDGYPGLLDIESLEECAEKLRTYLNLTLYKDIVRIFNLRDPRALEKLVVLIADLSSQRIDYSGLSSILGLKKDTLVKYLNYLESVFLLSRSEFYSRSRASRIKKAKKFYLSNVGLKNALVGALSESLLRDATELGKVVETLMDDHCRRLKFNLEPGSRAELFYWRTPQGKEVDIVFELFRTPVAIECKYRNEIRRGELGGIKQFLKEHGECVGIVITKDVLDFKGGIVFIPLWLFLIMC
ncbi:ATP-binding protein [Candidatus Pyrohabitans sp.]